MTIRATDLAQYVGDECRALLVVDRSGLVLAPLDSTELVELAPDEVEALVGSDALPMDAVQVTSGAALPDGARLRAVTPSMIRLQGGRGLVWYEPDHRYVALRRRHVALLGVLHVERSLADARDLLADQLDAGGAAVVAGDLERLGLVEVLEVEEPADVYAEAPHPIADDQGPDETLTHDPDPADDPLAEQIAVESGTADDHDTPGAPHGLFDGLPDRPGARAHVLAYRMAGRARRATRRGALAAARRTGSVLVRLGSPEHTQIDHESVEERSEDAGVGDAAPDHTVAVDTAPPDTPAVATAPLATPEIDTAPPDEATVDHVAVADVAVEAAPAPEPFDGHEDRTAAPIVDPRVPVFGVYHSPEHNANLGLGLIIAHARVVDHGSLNNRYDLRRASIDATPMLDELARTGRAAVALFSDYMWSIEHNLEVSRRVKELHPHTLTVHGGPHAPKYEDDAQAFFAEHEHVDVIVRGEGELVVASLLAAIDGVLDPTQRRDRLAEVEGITFRAGGPGSSELVRTPDRARADEPSLFPSPYLTGEFDDIDPARWRSATVEASRGCPYGCTFCDWGSATMSRIRKFDLERVFAELEWVAARGISEVFLADSNFGISARDVEIAQHIADLKRTYGAPKTVICSFAKNTVRHTAEIVRIWVEAGICAEGSVALQTTDPTTLANVERSNIKVEKYDALADEFRRHRLPIVTDLLMGLPGATVESFKADLQRCLDQEVTPRMMETVVLPNSPMNAPVYRQRFAIETDAANVIVATSSYSRDDFEEMKRIRLLFRAFEHFGLMRHLFLWLQHRHDIPAVELLHDIDRAICEDPFRYPLITWVGRYFDLVTAPPGGWPPFYDEVARLLADRHGIEADSELDTVLAVQQFVLPRKHRRFPDRIELRHDYVGWHEALRTKGAGTPPLSTFGPGSFAVDDPHGVCDTRLQRNGFSIRREEACDNPFWVLNDWELDSPLTRPMATAVGFVETA